MPRVHTFTCDRCKQEKTHTQPLTTGYGLTDGGEKHCFACCALDDQEYMDVHKKITLYLTKRDHEWYVTNWPGSLEYRVSSIHTGKHNLCGKRYDVHFKDYKGKWWHGTQYGDNTQLCHCQRIICLDELRIGWEGQP